MANEYYDVIYGQKFIGTGVTQVIVGLTTCRFCNLITLSSTTDGTSIYVGNDNLVTTKTGMELSKTEYLLSDNLGVNTNLFAICSTSPGATLSYYGLPAGNTSIDRQL